MTEKITSNQENRIADLVRDLVRALGLSKDEAQEIIANGGIMQREVSPIFRRLAIGDERFGPAIREFELTVPADYDHDTQIDTFAKKAEKQGTAYFFDTRLTSKNFAKATNKLEPGKTYKVKIFPVLEMVTNEDCISFYRKQHAILVGAQGLTLAKDLRAGEFPVDRGTVSSDEKDALWENSNGDHLQAFVYRYTNDGWGLGLGCLEHGWQYYCLLCFYEL